METSQTSSTHEADFTNGGDKSGDAVSSDSPNHKPEISKAAISNEEMGTGSRDGSSSNKALARAISSALSSVMMDFDSKAEDTLRSQDQLTFALDRLTRELDQLLEDAPLPFIMQHAARISVVRKRVLSLNSLLKSIQRRVDNIDRLLSVGMLHEKAIAESSRQH